MTSWPLKDADLGIAMGSGSAASRAVAELVLLDGRFATLPAVMAEGRRVIANIERVAKVFVTKTVYATLLALAVGVAGQPFPFLPRHLTLVSSLTIGIPGFFLALEPNTQRARPGFVRRVLVFADPAGVAAAAATFAIDRITDLANIPVAQARTTATLTLGLIGAGGAGACRQATEPAAGPAAWRHGCRLGSGAGRAVAARLFRLGLAAGAVRAGRPRPSRRPRGSSRPSYRPLAGLTGACPPSLTAATIVCLFIAHRGPVDWMSSIVQTERFHPSLRAMMRDRRCRPGGRRRAGQGSSSYWRAWLASRPLSIYRSAVELQRRAAVLDHASTVTRSALRVGRARGKTRLPLKLPTGASFCSFAVSAPA